jgi:hypothetical protein
MIIKKLIFLKQMIFLFKWDISTKGTVGELKTNSLNKIYNEIIDFFWKRQFKCKKNN